MGFADPLGHGSFVVLPLPPPPAAAAAATHEKAVVKNVPPPPGPTGGPLRALIYDSVYDEYKVWLGVVLCVMCVSCGDTGSGLAVCKPRLLCSAPPAKLVFRARLAAALLPLGRRFGFSLHRRSSGVDEIGGSVCV